VKTVHSDLEAIRELIHEQRRAILKARTISITLRSALDDFDGAIHDDLSLRAQVALRREWCERAAQMIQDLRVQALRTRALAARIKVGRGEGRVTLLELRELDVASDDAEHAIDVADEYSRRSRNLPA
jgi:hypothetical protein